MKKKMLAILLVLSVAAGSAGCSSAEGEAAGDKTAGQEEADPSAGAAETDGAEKTDDTAETEEASAVKDQIVAFIPGRPDSAFYDFANEGVQSYADEWGMEVRYINDYPDTPEGQADAVRQALTQGVDAICISVADAGAVSEALQEAADIGVVVCTWESDAYPQDRSLMVAPGAPESIGRLIAEMGADALGKRGTDPGAEPVRYCWHYSAAADKDQNFWQYEGERYIAETYPNWENIAPDNYYSGQDPQQAVSAGSALLEEHPDVDLILCNDPTALLGQLQAADDAGLTGEEITITGLASPSSVREYYDKGLLYQWGLWDSQTLASIGCYAAAYLAAGNSVAVNDEVAVPGIGTYTVEANERIETGAGTGEENSGVLLFEEFLRFDDYNIDDFDF